MSDHASKARDWVKKADKKATSFGWFGSNKYEEAAELYEKAGNAFKLSKEWKDAGETYCKLAEMHLKLDSRHEAASSYVEAAKAFSKVDSRAKLQQPQKALHKAVELYMEIGRLGMAAKQFREIAEGYEKDGLKLEAIEFYEKAADLFSTENSTSETNKCRLKVAQFSAELERYPDAIKIYEAIAKESVDNNLLRYSVKGYLLNAGICHLCMGDHVATEKALEKYDQIDITFAGSREQTLFKVVKLELLGGAKLCQIMQDLADAVEACDVDKFTNAIADFDSMTRLDTWKTQLLLRVKRKLEAADEEEEDLT